MSENNSNGFVYLPKESVEEPFYTVAEAMRLTGLSSTKFRYEPNKRELDARGADLSARIWRIPRTVLIDMGWLSPNAPLVAEPLPDEDKPVRSSVKRIQEQHAQIQELLGMLAERDTQLAVANATIKAKDAEIANLMTLLQDK